MVPIELREHAGPPRCIIARNVLTPVGAPLVGASTVPLNGGAIELLRATTANTREWNLLGLPALSVPCGFTAAGLPIGLQIVGRMFDESTVLRAARAHERRMPATCVVPRR